MAQKLRRIHIHNTKSNRCSIKNILSKTEGAADIEDVVQRGLGMLPQQANLRRMTQREIRENE